MIRPRIYGLFFLITLCLSCHGAHEPAAPPRAAAPRPTVPQSVTPQPALPQPVVPPQAGVKIEKSVVYGQAHGKNLTMDVFTPTGPVHGVGQGKGLLLLISGKWISSPKALQKTAPLCTTLVREHGYTVFAVTHGSQPEFVVSEIIPQITRSVRYVRANAKRFGIAPNRLGVIGFSSGGHLALMMGLRGDDGLANSPDPVERASSRVQAVIAFFPPTDFLNYGREGQLGLGTGKLGSMRHAFFREEPPASVEKAVGKAISPLYYVAPGDPPTLLIHGDRDPLVPLQQSERFQAAMKKSGVECELTVKHGGGHGWLFMEWDIQRAMQWLGRHLQ